MRSKIAPFLYNYNCQCKAGKALSNKANRVRSQFSDPKSHQILLSRKKLLFWHRVNYGYNGSNREIILRSHGHDKKKKSHHFYLCGLGLANSEHRKFYFFGTVYIYHKLTFDKAFSMIFYMKYCGVIFLFARGHVKVTVWPSAMTNIERVCSRIWGLGYEEGQFETETYSYKDKDYI